MILTHCHSCHTLHPQYFYQYAHLPLSNWTYLNVICWKFFCICNTKYLCPSTQKIFCHTVDQSGNVECDEWITMYECDMSCYVIIDVITSCVIMCHQKYVAVDVTLVGVHHHINPSCLASNIKNIFWQSDIFISHFLLHNTK